MILKGSSAMSWIAIASLCLAEIAQPLNLHTLLLDCQQRAGWAWDPLLLWCLESYPLVFLRCKYPTIERNNINKNGFENKDRAEQAFLLVPLSSAGLPAPDSERRAEGRCFLGLFHPAQLCGSLHVLPLLLWSPVQLLQLAASLLCSCV